MGHRVVIAEDLRMIREIFENAVTDASEYTLVASLPTAAEALSYIEKYDAELVIMDVLIPGSMNGLDAAARIKAVKPHVKVIIVTSMPELSYEKRAKEIGVEGFWQKEVQEQPLIEIMNRVMNGETVYPENTQRISIGNMMSDEFTEREIDILRELVTGASNNEIADKLCIEASTVKMHISNMLQKTGYHSRLELAVKARHLGIIINE
ncbi:response regulator transcription factor [Butyrivibrio sp. XPD2006]|uniref:response regulator transcription factor n=1 Tax=Butyrivibrio sp. XPD2006 TaxID=1280668 RepID=UPI0003B3AE45|nr:response regulator transcription factor [Butyrivibrio sp. XPD2006]